jgi:hypothetical protein
MEHSNNDTTLTYDRDGLGNFALASDNAVSIKARQDAGHISSAL